MRVLAQHDCFRSPRGTPLSTIDEEKAEIRRAFIKARSALVPLTEELAVEAAKVDVAMKRKVQGWGLTDSIVAPLHETGKKKLLQAILTFEGWLRHI